MQPRRRRLLLDLVLVAVSLAAGIGVGILFSRLWPSGPAPKPSSGAPEGIRVEELKSVEEMFSLAGQKAVVLKYSGGEVDFWIEVESKGKKEKFGQGLGRRAGGNLDVSMRESDKQLGPDRTVEGYFLWLRSQADDAGREEWKVAHRRDLVALKTSGDRASKPGAVSGSSSINITVPIWKGKVRQWSGGGPSGLPSTLSPGQEVCLQETEEKADESKDRHTIRIMCRAASQDGKPGEADSPAKE